MRKITLLIFSLITSLFCLSQFECHTECCHESSELPLLQLFPHGNSDRSSDDERLIIKLHITNFREDDGTLGLSEDDINFIVEGLNTAFTGANISFSFCGIEYIDDSYINGLPWGVDLDEFGGVTLPTFYVNPTNSFSSPNRLDLFLKTRIGPEFGVGLAFSSYTSAFVSVPLGADGILESNNLAVIYHEVGHCLSLRHTHEDATNSNDGVEDTPYDPGLKYVRRRDVDDYSEIFVNELGGVILLGESILENCESTLGENTGFVSELLGQQIDNLNTEVNLDEVSIDAISWYMNWRESWDSDTNEPYDIPTVNYMGYYRQICQNEFTQGQMDKVRNALLSTTWLQAIYSTESFSNLENGSSIDIVVSNDETITYTDEYLLINEVDLEDGSELIFQNSTLVFLEGIYAGLNNRISFDNCNIYTAGEKKIEIEANSDLWAENSLFSVYHSSECEGNIDDSRWEGIICNGTDAPSSEENIQIIDCRIEYAESGIAFTTHPETIHHYGSPIQQAEITWPSSFSVIGSVFEYNTINAIVYGDWRHYYTNFPDFLDLSYVFYGCDFKASYIEGTTPFSVFVKGVENVNFHGCNFSSRAKVDLYSALAQIKLHGTVQNGNGANQFSQYSGNDFEYSALNNYSIRSVNIPGTIGGFWSTATEFSSTKKKSVYISGDYTPYIHGNKFGIKAQEGVTEDNSYGLYLQGCTDYDISNNEFHGITIGATQAAGLVINDGGSTPNLVLNNIFYLDPALEVLVELGLFDPLYYSIISLNENGYLDENNTGLQFACNHFQNQKNAISVLAEDGNSSFGIATTQGSFAVPPFNKYHLSADYDLNNESDDYVFYYESVENTLPITIDLTTETGVLTTPEERDCVEYDFTEFTATGEIEGAFGTAVAEVIESKEILNALLDGGNTENLTNEVVFSDFTEAIQLTYSLLEKSPYLSDEVLIKVIEKEYDLPNPLLLLILQANPSAAKKGEIKDKIDAKLMPFSDYEKWLIKQGISLVNLKDHYQADLAAKVTHQNKLKIELVRRYAAANRTEDIITLLRNSDLMSDKIQASAMLINSQRAAEGLVLLETIDVTDYAVKSQAEIQLMKDYIRAYEQVVSKGGNFAEAEISELKRMESLNNGPASTWARNLLSITEEVNYTEPLIFPSVNRMAEIKEEFTEVNKTSIFPNPASDHVLISSSEIVKLVVVTDSRGKVVLQKAINQKQAGLNIENLANGIYLMKVVTESGEEVHKLIKE